MAHHLFRIALLIGTNQIGGAERQVALLAKGLQKKNIPVTVFFMSRPGVTKKQDCFDFSPVPCKYLWDSRYTRSVSIAYFALLLKLHRINMLHMFNLGAIEYGLSASHVAGVKCTIGSIRGILFSDEKKIRDRLKTVCQKTDYVTCNCNAIREMLITFQVCQPEKIIVIHNGISMKEQVKSSKGEYFTVLFVGTLKEVKDPLTFVRSALIVLETHSQCRFIIAGDGPLMKVLRNVTEHSKYKNRFYFLGNVQQEKIPYEDAHLLVSTSLREGSSNAILEALANGVPVVGTAVGGTKELLSSTSFGRLVNPGNVEAIASAIREFCSKTPAELKRIAEEARTFIRRNYSIEQMVDNHVSFYGEIVKKW